MSGALDDDKEVGSDSNAETLAAVEAVKNTTMKKLKGKKAAPVKKKKKVKATAPAVQVIHAH